jgi:hypothetical protein
METSRDAAPTGTIAISGTAVTGTTTDFTADYTVGDLMVYTNTLGLPEGRIVKTITDGTNIVLDAAPSATISSGAAHTVINLSSVLYAGGIDGPNESADEIEVTNLASVDKSFIGGNIDPGALSFPLYWQAKDTTHAALYTDFKAGQERWFVQWDPDTADFASNPPPDLSNSHWIFRGTVLNFGKSSQTGGAVQAQINVRKTGRADLIVGVDA